MFSALKKEKVIYHSMKVHFYPDGKIIKNWLDEVVDITGDVYAALVNDEDLV